MALIKCPECGKEISSAAVACPHCGMPNIPSASPASTSSANPVAPGPASPRQSYVDKTLLTGESVVFRTRLHWCHFLKMGTCVLFLFAAALASFYFKSDTNRFSVYFGLLCLLGAALTAGTIAIIYHTSEFAVTNKRVMIKIGFIKRTSFELLLKQVESILVEQSVAARLFGYGTVIISGTGGSKEDFDYISHPLEFRKEVQSQIASL